MSVIFQNTLLFFPSNYQDKQIASDRRTKEKKKQTTITFIFPQSIKLLVNLKLAKLCRTRIMMLTFCFSIVIKQVVQHINIKIYMVTLPSAEPILHDTALIVNC